MEASDPIQTDVLDSRMMTMKTTMKRRIVEMSYDEAVGGIDFVVMGDRANTYRAWAFDSFS
jgi:hypothetical protein